MLNLKSAGRKFILISTTIVTYALLAATNPIAAATESGCITCHLDKEMLKKTVSVKEGQKSALQSGAG